MISRNRTLLVTIFFCLAFEPGFALSVPTIDARTGIVWIGNSSAAGAPSPLLNTAGVAVPLQITSALSVAPELDVFGTQYQLSTGAAGEIRAIPAAIEFADSAWILSLILDIPVRYGFALSKDISLGFGVSPAFLFRIPTVTWGNGATQTGKMTAYFFGAGRFFYPTTQAYLDWQFTRSIALEVRLRAFFPIFHLWDGEKLPFYDQLMGEGNIGLKFTL